MSIPAPFLPVLAALSGQANQLEEDGWSSAQREASLMQALEYPNSDMYGVRGPDEVSAAKQDSEPEIEVASQDVGVSADESLLEGRRRPGATKALPDRVTQENIGAIRPPPPEAFPGDPDFPVPDRWRLSESLGLAHKERFFDPYNQNTYKGDRPLCVPSEEEKERRAKAGLTKCHTPRLLGLKSEDWFLVLGATSDTVVEPRSFPIPVGVQTTERPGSLDVFGRNGGLGERWCGGQAERESGSECDVAHGNSPGR